MSSPWLPVKLNFTGMARPALTTLTVGAPSMGWKKPRNWYFSTSNAPLSQTAPYGRATPR